MKEIIRFFLMLFALLVGSDQDTIQGEPVLSEPTQSVVQPSVLDFPLPTPQPIRPDPTACPIPVPATPTLAVIYITVGPPNPTPSGTPEPTIPYPTGIVIMTRIANPTIEGK